MLALVPITGRMVESTGPEITSPKLEYEVMQRWARMLLPCRPDLIKCFPYQVASYWLGMASNP